MVSWLSYDFLNNISDMLFQILPVDCFFLSITSFFKYFPEILCFFGLLLMSSMKNKCVFNTHFTYFKELYL